MRQIDVSAVCEPHERPDRRDRLHRAACCSTAGLYPDGSTLSSSGSGWEWSFRSPTPSRRPSSKMSRSTRGSRARRAIDALGEQCLREAALWDEVKSPWMDRPWTVGGQQHGFVSRGPSRRAGSAAHRRAGPALDPRQPPRSRPDLRASRDYTILIVTHNMQQAARVCDTPPSSPWRCTTTARGPARSSSSTAPRRSSPTPAISGREDYVTGRFG